MRSAEVAASASAVHSPRPRAFICNATCVARRNMPYRDGETDSEEQPTDWRISIVFAKGQDAIRLRSGSWSWREELSAIPSTVVIANNGKTKPLRRVYPSLAAQNSCIEAASEDLKTAKYDAGCPAKSIPCRRGAIQQRPIPGLAVRSAPLDRPGHEPISNTTEDGWISRIRARGLAD